MGAYDANHRATEAEWARQRANALRDLHLRAQAAPKSTKPEDSPIIDAEYREVAALPHPPAGEE